MGGAIISISTPGGESQVPRLLGIPVKYLSLVLLVFQNCAAVLLMRFTQTRVQSEKYSSAAVIISTELLKITICLVAILSGRARCEYLAQLLDKETLLMLIPAGLYTLQNVLLFVALANLEATLFQVTYQLKLLITALLMVVLLHKSLSRLRWISLTTLFLGIVLTQLKATASTKKETTAQEMLSGLVAVFVCSFSSGFASVYFEKLVKQGSRSLLVRNVQLGVFSTVLAWATFRAQGGSIEGFFDGFDAWVWILTVNQAAGGLIVAAVIKYADNILKGYATAIAIVVSGVFSYCFLDFLPTPIFLCGATIVILSAGAYALPDIAPAPMGHLK